VKRELLLVDDKLVDQTTEDLDALRAVADHCKGLQSSGLTKLTKLPGEMEVRHLATIPGFIVEKWCNDHGIAFDEFMRDPSIQTRMLNDPELRYFRVSPGRV
jgi:hypothetical protein